MEKTLPRGYRADNKVIDYLGELGIKHKIHKCTKENYKFYPGILTVNLLNFSMEPPHMVNLSKEMIDLAIEEKGVGLAANQVYELVPLFVALIGKRWKTFYKPEILEVSKEEIEGEEGCLSFPGQKVILKRPAWVRFTACGLDNKRKLYKVYGNEARCVIHEYSHLCGITIFDEQINFSQRR